MPQKKKSQPQSQSWADLKQAGNECFKKGQYGEATDMYSQAIKELDKSSEYDLHHRLHRSAVWVNVHLNPV